MLQRAPAATRSYETQMLAAADRLFAEFDRLPVMTVVRSINGARSHLRALGVVPSPLAIEAAAREQMRALVPGGADRAAAREPTSARAGAAAMPPAEPAGGPSVPCRPLPEGSRRNA